MDRTNVTLGWTALTSLRQLCVLLSPVKVFDKLVCLEAVKALDETAAAAAVTSSGSGSCCSKRVRPQQVHLAG